MQIWSDKTFEARKTDTSQFHAICVLARQPFWISLLVISLFIKMRYNSDQKLYGVYILYIYVHGIKATISKPVLKIKILCTCIILLLGSQYDFVAKEFQSWEVCNPEMIICTWFKYLKGFEYYLINNLIRKLRFP